MCCFNGLSAQDISSKNNLEKIELYGNTNIDSLKFYAKKSQLSNDPCVKKLGEINEASVHYKEGDFVTSEKLSLQVIHSIIKKELPCKNKILLTAYNRLFWIKKNQGKYNTAFNYLLEKQKIVEQLPEKNTYYHIHRLSINTNMASIKAILGLHKEAIEILYRTNSEFKNLKLEKNQNDVTNLKVIHISTLNLIADSYYNLSHKNALNYLDSAAVYYKQAYNIALTFTPIHKNTEGLYSLRQVKIYSKKGQFNTADSIINRIKKIEENEQEIYFYNSSIHFNLKNSDSTIYFANRFLNYQKTSPNTKKNRLIIYDILANQYNDLNKPDSAYKYSRLGLLELSELDSNKEEINEAHYQYNFNVIKEKNTNEINKEHTTHVAQIISIISLSVVSISLVFFFYNKKRKKTSENFNNLIDEIKNNDNTPKKDYNIDKELEQAILYALENLENSDLFLRKEFNLKSFAKKTKTNTTYISYIINNKKGQSFKQYIAKLRIDYLIKMLKSDPRYRNYTIQYLAGEIGYSNASAFSRAFKNHTNTTPSEFLKSLE